LSLYLRLCRLLHPDISSSTFSDTEVVDLGFGEPVVRSPGHKVELLVLEMGVNQT